MIITGLLPYFNSGNGNLPLHERIWRIPVATDFLYNICDHEMFIQVNHLIYIYNHETLLFRGTI